MKWKTEHCSSKPDEITFDKKNYILRKDIHEEYHKATGDMSAYTDWVCQVAFTGTDEAVDYLNELRQENTDQISDTQTGLMETYEMSDTNAQDIADNRTAIMEIYELLEGGNE